MTYNQLRNLVTFIALMRGEDMSWSSCAPEYALEKYARYCSADIRNDESWRWGVHPTLQEHISRYFEVWKTQVEELIGEEVPA